MAANGNAYESKKQDFFWHAILIKRSTVFCRSGNVIAGLSSPLVCREKRYFSTWCPIGGTERSDRCRFGQNDRSSMTEGGRNQQKGGYYAGFLCGTAFE